VDTVPLENGARAAHALWLTWFGFECLGFRVQGSGIRVWGIGLRVWGEGLESWVKVSGFGVRDLGL